MTHHTGVDASSFRSTNCDHNLSEKLQSVSDGLSRRDLDALQFLFHDSHPGHQELAIQSGIDLFTSVQRLFAFGDFLPRLVECLCLIGRNDLVLHLGDNPDRVRRELRQNIHYISDYRLFLFKIAEELNAQDLKNMKNRQCDWMTAAYRERIISHHSFLLSLEAGGRLSRDDFSLLSQLLLELRRDDLVKRIKDAPSFHVPKKANTDSVGAADDVAKQNLASLDKGRENLDRLVEEYMERLKKVKIEEDMRSADDMPQYSMRAELSGVCLIINNETFSATSHLDNRPGSSLDVVNLERTFTQLNFHVVTQSNLTTQDMLGCVYKVSQADHSAYDAFICCILTHGKPGKLHGIEGNLVDIIDLTTMFAPSYCPSLTGKPKMFFIQACRGLEKQTGAALQTDAPRPEPRPTIPEEADFLHGYATAFGYLSYRSTEQGTWYIYTLTELLNRHAHSHDLLSILTRVNEEVARGVAFTHYKQVPAPVTTLRKKVAFKLRASHGQDPPPQSAVAAGHGV